MLSAKQMKMARAALDWSRDDLANASNGEVSAATVKLIETNKVNSTPGTLGIIQKTLEDNGIEFTSQDGVRMRSAEMRVYEGKEGLISFYDDIYETLKNSDNKEVFVSNVNERYFIEALGGYAATHQHRMEKMNVTYKIIIEEGDDFMPASSFAQYKKIPSNLHGGVPFYGYGDKLAIMLFNLDFKVFILHNAQIRDAYLKQFNFLWQYEK